MSISKNFRLLAGLAEQTTHILAQRNLGNNTLQATDRMACTHGFLFRCRRLGFRLSRYTAFVQRSGSGRKLLSKDKQTACGDLFETQIAIKWWASTPVGLL